MKLHNENCRIWVSGALDPCKMISLKFTKTPAGFRRKQIKRKTEMFAFPRGRGFAWGSRGPTQTAYGSIQVRGLRQPWPGAMHVRPSAALVAYTKCSSKINLGESLLKFTFLLLTPLQHTKTLALCIVGSNWLVGGESQKDHDAESGVRSDGAVTDR